MNDGFGWFFIGLAAGLILGELMGGAKYQEMIANLPTTEGDTK